MSVIKRYLKNIYKQYGKNMEKFEDMLSNNSPSKEVLDFREKYGIHDVKPMISIKHSRWGFPSRENNLINSVSDIKEVSQSE